MAELTLERDHTAILVMDCQNDIVHENGKFAPWGFARMVQEQQVLEHIRRLVEAARGAGVPVIYVVLGYRSDYADLPDNAELFKGARGLQALAEGSWGAKVHDLVAPQPGDFVVLKKRVNAFYGSELEPLLHTRGVHNLVLSGVATNFVVEGTARHAADGGYRVIIPRDCCSSMNREVHDFTLTHILPILATITTSEEVIQGLRGTG